MKCIISACRAALPVSKSPHREQAVHSFHKVRVGNPVLLRRGSPCAQRIGPSSTRGLESGAPPAHQESTTKGDNYCVVAGFQLANVFSCPQDGFVCSGEQLLSSWADAGGVCLFLSVSSNNNTHLRG